MTIKQLDHLNLTVSDLDRTLAWYSAVFGMEVVEHGVRQGTRWAIIKGGEAMLCAYETPERTTPAQFRVNDVPRHSIYHWGFRITDRDAWERTIAEHKLEVEYGGAVDYPHSLSWYVTDPTGYGIEVVLWKDDVIAFDTQQPSSAMAI